MVWSLKSYTEGDTASPLRLIPLWCLSVPSGRRLSAEACDPEPLSGDGLARAPGMPWATLVTAAMAFLDLCTRIWYRSSVASGWNRDILPADGILFY